MTLKGIIFQTIKLAIPVMITQAGTILVNVVDNIMVGNLEGEKGINALGAISLGNAIFFSGLVLLIGFSFSMSPLIAQAIVQNKTQRVQSILSSGITINFILSIIVFLSFWFSIDLIYLLDQPQKIIPITISYLKINLISLFPFILFQSLRQFSEGLSLTIPIMISVILSNILNVIFNYFLIYGNFGFPRLEVDGAAWATFISRIFMMIILFGLLYKNKKSSFFIKQINWFSINKLIARRIIKLGIPSSLQLFFEVTAFAIAAFICGKTGPDNLAAHQISITMASVTFMLCTGLSVAGTIRVGNQFGLKNYKIMKLSGQVAIGLAAIIMLFSGVIMIIFRSYLPTFFNDSPKVIFIASNLLIIAALFQLSDGIQVVTVGCLRGLQDVNIPTIISFIAYYLITLPLGYYLAIIEKHNALGMWIALGIGLTISAIWLYSRFIKLTNKLILD